MPAVPGSAGARVRVGRGTAGIDQKINLFRPLKACQNVSKSTFFNPKHAKMVKICVFHPEMCQNGQNPYFLKEKHAKILKMNVLTM